jgi:hypothetical protein
MPIAPPRVALHLGLNCQEPKGKDLTLFVDRSSNRLGRFLALINLGATQQVGRT